MITEISIGESLIVTVFSIIVVFATLIVIAGVINAIKLFSTDDKKKETNNVQPEVAKEEVGVVQTKENSEELVAVIAAAIAASIGVNAQDINIKTIRRVYQSSTPWSIISKQEQIYGKF